MSTRSNIGILNQDGTVDYIYCHFDGYVEHNMTLTEAKTIFDEAFLCQIECLYINGNFGDAVMNPETTDIIRYFKTANPNLKVIISTNAGARSKKFWRELAQVADQIRYIEFTGGEPFMIEEHFELLRSLVSSGLAPNIEIHYNTNGTQWPEHAEEIWKHFKLVEIAFSIDDVGPRFEYQRSNAIWSEVEANIAKFRELRHHCPNIQLQVCATVNVFNVYYVEELANWIDQQAFDFVYWNVMHDAPYFSIANLPKRAKQSITNRLITAQVSDKNKQEFVKIMDFMNNGRQDMSERMLAEIRRVDHRRSYDGTQGRHWPLERSRMTSRKRSATGGMSSPAEDA
mgnify:CR=1 FL=1